MSIDSPAPVEKPVQPTIPEGNQAFHMFDLGDLSGWQNLASLRLESQNLMQRLGLSNFSLDNPASGKNDLASIPRDSGANLDRGEATNAVRSPGASAARRTASDGVAGSAPAGTGTEWVKPIASSPTPELSTKPPADVPNTSHKPDPSPEVTPSAKPQNGRALAPADGKMPPLRHALPEEVFPPFVMPSDPETWVKPEIKPGVSLDSARQSVDDAVARNLSPTDALHFKADMKTFEGRAKSDHLSDRQVADTYQNISQLLNAKDGPLNSGDRHRLAEQVIALAANPNKAVTGTESGTCGDAELEALTYKHSPEAAANLVAQVAMGATFTANDGIAIRPEMLPTEESRRTEDPTARLHASQIFQNTAIDLALKERGFDLTYHHGYGGNGASGGGEFYLNSKGKRLDYDGTYPEDLIAAYHGITGKNDLTVIDSNSGIPDTENIKHVHSPKQLQAVLDGINSKGNAPAIIGVDERNQPFWDQNHAGSPAEGNEDPHANYYHWAAINSYDPQTGTISYHNGWDDVNHKISVDDMYHTTIQVDSNLPRMGKDFVQTLNEGHGNYAEAIDALRIRSETGRISDYDLNRLLNRNIEGLFAQRGSHSLDDQTVNHDVWELVSYLNGRKTLNLAPHVNELLTGWFSPPTPEQ